MKDTLSYENFVKNELEGKCLLEIVLKGQADITYRALEAQFYKRKLITNCVEIKKYDFYTPKNIFVLGEDSVSKLKLWLKEPYQPISEKKLYKYQFDGWIENFF